MSATRRKIPSATSGIAEIRVCTLREKEFAREPSERMSIERAFEILDPTHRERYESLEPVNEACRMGRAALFLQMKESPYPDGDEGVLACPNCGSGEYLHNEDGNRNRFCGQCGKAIAWNEEADK